MEEITLTEILEDFYKVLPSRHYLEEKYGTLHKLEDNVKILLRQAYDKGKIDMGLDEHGEEIWNERLKELVGK